MDKNRWIGLLAVLSLAACTEDQSTPAPHGLIGYEVCQHYVRLELSEPDYAKFPLSPKSETVLSDAPKIVRIESVVDAQLSNGEKEQLPWICTVRADDPAHGQWSVLAISLEYSSP